MGRRNAKAAFLYLQRRFWIDRVELVGHLRAAQGGAEAEKLAAADRPERDGGEGKAQADADAGKTEAGSVLAVAENADDGDQAENDGRDRADDGEGADDGQKKTGEGETAGAYGRPLQGRRLERLLALGTGDGLAGQRVLDLESRSTVADERQRHG